MGLVKFTGGEMGVAEWVCIKWVIFGDGAINGKIGFGRMGPSKRGEKSMRCAYQYFITFSLRCISAMWVIMKTYPCSHADHHMHRCRIYRFPIHECEINRSHKSRLVAHAELPPSSPPSSSFSHPRHHSFLPRSGACPRWPRRPDPRWSG